MKWFFVLLCIFAAVVVFIELWDLRGVPENPTPEFLAAPWAK